MVGNGVVSLPLTVHEQISKAEVVGEFFQRLEACGTNKTHHITIQIASVGALKLDACPSFAIEGRSVVATETDDIASGKSDRLVPLHIHPIATVLTALDGFEFYRFIVVDCNRTTFNSLKGQWRSVRVEGVSSVLNRTYALTVGTTAILVPAPVVPSEVVGATCILRIRGTRPVGTAIKKHVVDTPTCDRQENGVAI